MRQSAMGLMLLLVGFLLIMLSIVLLELAWKPYSDRVCPRQQYFCHVNNNPLHGPTWPAQ